MGIKNKNQQQSKEPSSSILLFILAVIGTALISLFITNRFSVLLSSSDKQHPDSPESDEKSNPFEQSNSKKVNKRMTGLDTEIEVNTETWRDKATLASPLDEQFDTIYEGGPDDLELNCFTSRTFQPRHASRPALVIGNPTGAMQCSKIVALPSTNNSFATWIANNTLWGRHIDSTTCTPNPSVETPLSESTNTLSCPYDIAPFNNGYVSALPTLSPGATNRHIDLLIHSANNALLKNLQIIDPVNSLDKPRVACLLDECVVFFQTNGLNDPGATQYDVMAQRFSTTTLEFIDPAPIKINSDDPRELAASINPTVSSTSTDWVFDWLKYEEHAVSERTMNRASGNLGPIRELFGPNQLELPIYPVIMLSTSDDHRFYVYTNASDVWLQQTFPNGSFKGSPIRLNTFTRNGQYEPQAILTKEGTLIAEWTDESKDYNAVMARRVGEPTPTKFFFPNIIEGGNRTMTLDDIYAIDIDGTSPPDLRVKFSDVLYGDITDQQGQSLQETTLQDIADGKVLIVTDGKENPLEAKVSFCNPILCSEPVPVVVDFTRTNDAVNFSVNRIDLNFGESKFLDSTVFNNVSDPDTSLDQITLQFKFDHAFIAHVDNRDQPYQNQEATLAQCLDQKIILRDDRSNIAPQGNVTVVEANQTNTQFFDFDINFIPSNSSNAGVVSEDNGPAIGGGLAGLGAAGVIAGFAGFFGYKKYQNNSAHKKDPYAYFVNLKLYGWYNPHPDQKLSELTQKIKALISADKDLNIDFSYYNDDNWKQLATYTAQAMQKLSVQETTRTGKSKIDFSDDIDERSINQIFSHIKTQLQSDACVLIELAEDTNPLSGKRLIDTTPEPTVGQRLSQFFTDVVPLSQSTEDDNPITFVESIKNTFAFGSDSDSIGP